MRLCIVDWEFEVDICATMTHGMKLLEERCLCGYCMNYYKVAGEQQGFTEVLAMFGVNFQAPDKLSVYEPTLLDADYTVYGRILQYGLQPIQAGDFSIIPEQQSEDSQTFKLHIDLFSIPWCIDEDMEEVISPANDPQYLETIYRQLIDRIGKDKVQS